MRHNQAVVTAVLSTVLRATVDAALPVVLRNGRPEQARDLARWLERMHGSRRIVLTSRQARGPIQVSLPGRMRWPDRSELCSSGPEALPTARSSLQFSPMPPSFTLPGRH